MLRQAIGILRQLVAINTESRRSNLDLVVFVEKLLAGHGLRCIRIPNADGTKSNLIATVGPARDGGIVLSGHTDVVPVEGQEWRTDPFEVTEIDGRLYGRGTADMKGFIAAALAMVPAFLEIGLERPIHLALSYDEETGCLGAPDLVAHVARYLPRPAAVIVGEPTGMCIVNRHKGGCLYRSVVEGIEAHSSLPQNGISAVMLAGRLIRCLHEVAEDLKQGPFDDDFTPPWSSASANAAVGGTAGNILAGECAFTWDLRCIPGDDPQVIFDRFDAACRKELAPERQRWGEAVATSHQELARIPALRPEPEGTAESLLRRLMESGESRAAGFGTEAGLYQEAGLSTVVCGPGSIQQAHRADEFVEVAQLQECLRLLEAVGNVLSRELPSSAE